MPTITDLSTIKGNGKSLYLFAKQDAWPKTVRIGGMEEFDRYYPDLISMPPTQLAIDEVLDGPDGDDGLPYDPDLDQFEAELAMDREYDRDLWRRQFELEELMLDSPREIELEAIAAAHTPTRITRGMQKAAGYTPRRERRAHRAARNDGKIRYGSNRRHCRREKGRLLKEYFAYHSRPELSVPLQEQNLLLAA